jgi:hypothetical protein
MVNSGILNPILALVLLQLNGTAIHVSLFPLAKEVEFITLILINANANQVKTGMEQLV